MLAASNNKRMDKQYKIVKKVFLPQLITGLIILSLLICILIFNNVFNIFPKSYNGSIVGFSILLILVVIVLFNNRTNVGFLQFDSYGINIYLDNSVRRIQFLDEKLISLRIKLKIGKQSKYVLFPNYYADYNSSKILNQIELQYIDSLIVYNFEIDNHMDFKDLIDSLRNINDKAKILLN